MIFRKSVENIEISLKSDTNNGYFTWRLTFIYDIAEFFPEREII